MNFENKVQFRRGLRDGFPVCLGYLTVAFTLGITARNAGLTAIQAAITSFTNHASAGEFVGLTLIAAQAGLFELALMELVANARYLLMSCAMSQKLSPDTSLIHRLLTGFSLTDEVFALSMAQPGRLNPWYTYGAFLIAVTGWTAGSYFGVLMGNILPPRAVSALSVGLYGMFIAVIIPPTRKDKFLRGLIVIAMLASLGAQLLNVYLQLSEGMRIILLTILISSAAALIRPVKDDEGEEKEAA